MSIAHIRIDERLVHGQVASVWVNTIGANRIMVINDIANQDAFQKQMLRMATPSGISLSVLTVEKAIDRVKSGNYDNEKVLVILKDTETAVRLLENGFEMNSINIGNISNKGDGKEVFKGVFLSKDDTINLDKLIDNNIEITIQTIPSQNIVRYKD